MRPTTEPTDAPDFAALLAQATTEPGILSAAYTAFHQYSLGNMLLALGQCEDRGITLGPLATFPRWKELRRFVKKGEKAIALIQPITVKRRAEQPDDEPETYTRFTLRRSWFVLTQTDGEPYTPPELPDWNRERALAALDITEIPFEHIDGNCQGYARARSIAVSPVAALPFKTTCHEMAHVLLGHTAEAELNDDDRTPRTIRELEAEATAMLVCAALNQPGIPEARGYIQHWIGTGQDIPEASARKIFKTADQILKAGRLDGPRSTEAA
jgi:antirestriction protein ArdC